MRVSRRIRPSQVGCAASASRRRLQAASLTVVEEPVQPRPLPRPSLVIQPDGQILSSDRQRDPDARAGAYDDVDAAAFASVRG